MPDFVKLSSSGGISAEFPLEILRKPGRRTMVMRLKYPNVILVSAPMRVSKAEILNFVAGNSDWVFSALKSLKEPVGLLGYLRENPYVFEAGKALKVSFFNSHSPKGFWIGDFLKGEIVFAFPDGDEVAFKNLFLKYAAESIAKTVSFVAQRHNFKVPKISVRDQRSRWASRSSSGRMSFNWRLTLLKCEFQEYVVLHEFAHEKFMDHSVSFWIYLNRLVDGARRLDNAVSAEGAKVFNVER